MAKRRGHDAKGRTTGEPRFVQIPYWVLETAAARTLSGTAFKVLVYLLKRFNGVNNGKIGFGCYSGCFIREPGQRDLIDASIGFKHRTVSDALYELEHAGFIQLRPEEADARMADHMVVSRQGGGDQGIRDGAGQFQTDQEAQKAKARAPARPIATITGRVRATIPCPNRPD
jgi:DNA-binding MarR family transcriptional regulator